MWIRCERSSNGLDWGLTRNSGVFAVKSITKSVFGQENNFHIACIIITINTTQKIKFFIKDFSVNVTKSAVSCGFCTFTEEILKIENFIFCAVQWKQLHNPNSHSFKTTNPPRRHTASFQCRYDVVCLLNQITSF